MYMYIHVCAHITVHCTCTLVTCTRSLSSLPNALSLSASTSSKCLTLPSILSTDRVAFISLSLASPSLACHSISLAAAFFESFRARSNSWRLDCCSSSWANLSWKERQGGRRQGKQGGGKEGERGREGRRERGRKGRREGGREGRRERGRKGGRKGGREGEREEEGGKRVRGREGRQGKSSKRRKSKRPWKTSMVQVTKTNSPVTPLSPSLPPPAISLHPSAAPAGC